MNELIEEEKKNKKEKEEKEKDEEKGFAIIDGIYYKATLQICYCFQSCLSLTIP